MSIKISYLLPTNRQQTNPQILQQAISSINQQPTKYDYEILVYSEDEVVGDHVRWIKEDKRRGPIFGINLLARKYAGGDYLVVLTDDIYFLSSIDLCIDMVESPNFQYSRKYKICGLGCGGTCAIPARNTRIGNVVSLQEDMPTGIILRWPIVHKDTMNTYLNGYIFHPRFYHAAADIWLGYYLAVVGEPAIEGPTQIRPINNLHNASWELQDSNTAHALITNNKNGDPGYMNLALEKEYNDINPDVADIFL